MAGRIHQVLTFNAVPASGQATLAHDIRWNSRHVKPDWVIPQNGNGAWTLVACTETSITIQNDEAAPANFTFWLLSHHSITREFGNVATQFLSPLPFALGGGGGGGGGSTSNLVVWDTTKTWAAVYLEIQALTGPVICLVEADPAVADGARTMTAEGGGAPTDISDVWFVAGSPNYDSGNGNALAVKVDVDDGFVLGTIPPAAGLTADLAVLRSKNIDWHVPANSAPWVVDADVRLFLEGGSLSNAGLSVLFDWTVGLTMTFDISDGIRLSGPIADNSAGTTIAGRVYWQSSISSNVFETGVGASIGYDASCSAVGPSVFNVAGASAVLTMIDALAVSNLVVWDVNKTWAEAYAEIVGKTGPVICLVEFDYVTSLPRQMTMQGAGAATNLWNVLFMALAPRSSAAQIVRVEVEDGFVLGADPTTNSALLQSQNILWTPLGTTVSSWTVGKHVLVAFDGGGLDGAGAPNPVFDLSGGLGLAFWANLTNRAALGQGVPEIVDNTGFPVTCDVTLTNGSTIGGAAFATGANTTVNMEANCDCPTTAFTAAPASALIQFEDLSSQVFYDDTTAVGPNVFGTGNVQGAVDILKAMSWPVYRNWGWAAGIGTTITAITHWGLFVPTLGSGTINAASATDGTAVVTGLNRKRFTSAAGANNACELFQGSVFIGMYISALVGFGGFRAIMRFAPGITNPANKRGFFGFVNDGAALVATLSPSTLINCFGFAFDAGETTFRFQHNDGAGAATRINLGANFPTRDATALFTIMIWCEPNTRAVNYWIKNETTGDVASGVVTTDLPANGLGLAPHMHENNGGTASATEWDFAYASFFMP